MISTSVTLSLKFVKVMLPGLTLLQLTGVDSPWMGSAERLTLVTALVIAAGALWKSLRSDRDKYDTSLRLDREKHDAITDAKDKQIISMIEHVTAANVTQVETNRELRKIVEESVHTKQELKASVDLLNERLSLFLSDPMNPDQRENAEYPAVIRNGVLFLIAVAMVLLVYRFTCN